MLDKLAYYDNVRPKDAVTDSGRLSAMTVDLIQSDLFRQLKQGDSSNSVLKNGFPDLQIEKMEAKADSAKNSGKFADSRSPFATGAELISERELKQAGLNPKDVRYEGHTEKNGDKDDKTTVKYPDGLEVTVDGKFNSSKTIGQAHTRVELPEGYSLDPKNPNAILDKKGHLVAQINVDTVSVKVNGKWLDQGPAGITEATVIENRDGHGIHHIGEKHSDYLKFRTGN